MQYFFCFLYHKYLQRERDNPGVLLIKKVIWVAMAVVFLKAVIFIGHRVVHQILRPAKNMN